MKAEDAEEAGNLLQQRMLKLKEQQKTPEPGSKPAVNPPPDHIVVRENPQPDGMDITVIPPGASITPTGGMEQYIEEIAEKCRQSNTIGLKDTEIKEFLLILEKMDPGKRWASAILREVLLKTLPKQFPAEWKEFQELRKKHNLTTSRRAWKL